MMATQTLSIDSYQDGQQVRAGVLFCTFVTIRRPAARIVILHAREVTGSVLVCYAKLATVWCCSQKAQL